MPRAHSGILPRQALRRRLAILVATVAIVALAPARAQAEGPLTRAARAYATTMVPARAPRPAAQPAARGRRRSPGRVIAGAAVGAAGGFFAGAYLGAAIDGDCGGCDDPGFKGFLIGAPIGAVAGGILGGKFLF